MVAQSAETNNFIIGIIHDNIKFPLSANNLSGQVHIVHP